MDVALMALGWSVTGDHSRGVVAWVLGPDGGVKMSLTSVLFRKGSTASPPPQGRPSKTSPAILSDFLNRLQRFVSGPPLLFASLPPQ